MANEMVQGLLQNLLQPTQGPSPADIMAALSSRSPAASVAAMQAPQLSQMFGQQFRGLIGAVRGQPAPMTGNEAYAAAVQQLSQQPGFMNNSESLLSLAKAASAVGRMPEAMQFSMLASQAQQQEAERNKNIASQSLVRNTNISAIDSAIASVDASKYPGLINALEGLKNQYASEQEPSDPSKVQTTISSLFERYKVELVSPEATNINYQTPEGNLVTYRTNKEGMVAIPSVTRDANGAVIQSTTNWTDPASLSLTIAPTRTMSTTRTDETLSINDPFVTGALQRAKALNLLPDDPNSPAAQSFLNYLQAGKLNSYEDIPKFFEGYAETPQARQARQTLAMNVASESSLLLNNVDRALNFVNDPTANIGPTFTILEDYPIETAAGNFKAVMESLTAQQAFSAMQELRKQAQEVGSTGTGLGPTAVAEFQALSNAMSNLKTTQGREQIAWQLNKIKLHSMNLTRMAANQPRAILKSDINSVYPQQYFKQDPRTGQTYYDTGEGNPLPVILFDDAQTAISTLMTPPR